MWDEEGDPGINHYPLMSTPWPTVAITACYLYFVKLAGPSIMKSRTALEVNQLMICYNFIMVALSAWMTMEAFLTTNFTISAWSCKESQRIHSSTDPQDQILSKRLSFVLWVFFFSKFIEFADTVFMVLRKKNQQVSKLHVIHHSVVPLSVWIGLKFAPTAINMWFPFLNSLVHTFMYAYYGLMAVEGSLNSNVKILVKRFKPWVTRIQIIQFVLALLHCAIRSIASMRNDSCVVPKAYLYPSLMNAILFLVLFLNFYFQSYTDRKIRAKKSDSTSDANNNNNGVVKKPCESIITSDSTPTCENIKGD